MRTISCYHQTKFHATAPFTASYVPYKLHDSHQFVMTTIITTNRIVSRFFACSCKTCVIKFYQPMYLNTVGHKRIIHIYTFSQTSRKKRKWLRLHSCRFITLIVGLNRNFYYLHSALHKSSAGHASYNCTLSGGIGTNQVAVKIIIKLTRNKQYAKIFVVRIN